ncbi:MAG: Rieske 2Fe-2S domain-containing protein [Chlorobi bacterium]|nr:Rieske 2Fe-2S domain-containing protein [Chlorobiota bacterium]
MKFIPVLPLSELPPGTHRTVKAGAGAIALFHYDGRISALGHACLHKGGDLGEGILQRLDDGELYVSCPWHGWQYNIRTGQAPHGYLDRQAVFDARVEDGVILVSEKPVVTVFRAEHEHDGLGDLRRPEYLTTPDSLHVLGISATNMNRSLPRPSTSETALQAALDFAASEYGAGTRMTRLRDLQFRHCEGYYSRHEEACTWPCSITEMDPEDGMTGVYRDLVLWADVVLLATPIRWGNASSLYYKMAERLNTVQNQITLHDRVLIRNKVVSFIITGGQDNVQGVAGQLNAFFADLGFVFPPFNYMGWSRGWIAEDMQHNVERFMKSRYVKRSVKELVANAVQLLRQLKLVDTGNIQTPKPRITEAGGLTEQPETGRERR